MDTIRCIAFILLFHQSFAYFKCPQGSIDDFYRDPEDCTKFHRCYEGTRQATFSCPPGTYFDELIASCDHAYKVKCDTDKYLAGSNIQRVTAKPSSNIIEESDLDPLLDWRTANTPQRRSQQPHGYYNLSRIPQGSDYSRAQYRQAPQSTEVWTPPKSSEVWKPSDTYSRNDPNEYQRREQPQRYKPEDYLRGQYTQSPLRETWTQPKSRQVWKPNPTLPSYKDPEYNQQKEPIDRYNPGDYSRGREPQSRPDNRYPSVNKPNYDYNQQRPQSGSDSSKQGYTQGYPDRYYTQEPGRYQPRGYTQPDYRHKEPETDRRYQRPESGRDIQKPGQINQPQKPDSPLYQEKQPLNVDQRKPIYEGSDNQFPSGSHTRYGSNEDKRPEYDGRRYPDRQNPYYDQKYTTASYINRNPNSDQFQNRDPRKENRQPDIYKYSDPFELVTRSPYSRYDQPDYSHREPNYGRDWSQRQPSSQTRKPYKESNYERREPRREPEFGYDRFPTTKSYTSIEPDLTSLQNLSKSNYDTLYQLCLRLYPQEEQNPQYNYKRGSESEARIRADKQQICEQFNPSRQKLDSNYLPDLPLDWQKPTTPLPSKDRTGRFETNRKETSYPRRDSNVDVEPENRNFNFQKPNYNYDYNSNRDGFNLPVTTKAPWRIPKYTQYYSDYDRERYQPRPQSPNLDRPSDRQYTRAPFKPPYQHHTQIDSQRKIDHWPINDQRSDLYASSSNTDPRIQNNTDDFSNFIPNEDPFAIHNLISDMRCEDTHLRDCQDCETLSYLKFPKVSLKSTTFENYNLRVQTVEKECFQLCLEKDCIAYSFSNTTGNCSIYLSDVSGDAVKTDADYFTVVVEPKVAILKEEWIITSPAAPAGKPMAVISSDNSIKCLQMCYQIGEMCKAVGYDYNTKICKFYDDFNGKKLSLKSNTIAVQHKNISDFEEQWGNGPHTRITPDRQHICVKFNPSRKTQKRNQLQDLSPQSLKLTEDKNRADSSDQYPVYQTISIPEPSKQPWSEPLKANRQPYIYTEENPFQIMTGSPYYPDYGNQQPGDNREKEIPSQTRKPHVYEGRQPRREKEFEDWFTTTEATTVQAKQNDTLYRFCLELYSQVQSTPIYNDYQSGDRQSIIRPDKQHICNQFNPNRQKPEINQIPDAPSSLPKYGSQSERQIRKERFETYPKEPFKPIGHQPETTTTQTTENPNYKLERIKTWWSWDDDLDKAGRCGVGAPKINGVFPTCNPDSRSSYCCGYTGYCGSGAAFCDCTLCVNFKKNPTFRW